jgi:hypothetical protein
MRGHYILVLCAVLGCSDPLKDAQRIEELRVLAVRLEVDGDASRAWPSPGDTVTARFLTAAPQSEPAIGWQLVACLAAPTTQGIVGCAEAPFARAQAAAVGPEEPMLRFAVPAELLPGHKPRLAVLGAICEGEVPEFGSELSQADCAGDAPILVTFDAPIAVDDDEINHHPTLADALVEIDGAAWLAPAGAVASCSAAAPSAELPQFTARSGDHRIVIALSDDDRDPLIDASGLLPPFETLQLSHFSTAGLLERPFSVIEGGAERLDVQVTWAAPNSAPEGGLLTRFYFVVRDLRGGVDWTVRQACVVR